jgi:hypothetical protein
MRASQADLDAPRRWGHLEVSGATTLRQHGTGRCDAPHWGYVIRGVLRVTYPDHEEVISAGDAYYVAPEHLGLQLVDAELIDFSPSPTAVPSTPATAASRSKDRPS